MDPHLGVASLESFSYRDIRVHRHAVMGCPTKQCCSSWFSRFAREWPDSEDDEEQDKAQRNEPRRDALVVEPLLIPAVAPVVLWALGSSLAQGSSDSFDRHRASKGESAGMLPL
jgi:hypothetical protein